MSSTDVQTDSAVERYAATLTRFVSDRPDFRAVLERICDRMDRCDGLSGSMKLGQTASLGKDGEFLMGVFGPGVRTTKNGEVVLQFDRFFASLSGPSAKDTWSAAVYRALARKPRSRQRERADLVRVVDQVLARWRLAFPRLKPVADHLAATVPKLVRRAGADSPEALQELLFQAGDIVSFLLSNHSPMTLADLGAHFCNDSKALRNTDLIRISADWLLVMETGAGSRDQRERRSTLARHGVIDNPTAARAVLFGPIEYHKADRWFSWPRELWTVGESAILSLDNLKGVDAVRIGAPTGAAPTVTTCENETPFCRLVREQTTDVVIYTEGYPNAAVMRVIELLGPDTALRHWGDSDLDGLRIAAGIRRAHPLTLWRCALPELQRHRTSLSPLSAEAHERANRFLERHREFPFRGELTFTIQHGWLEQESWREP